MSDDAKVLKKKAALEARLRELANKKVTVDKKIAAVEAELKTL